ncbi:MAG: hypothetical protein DDT27_01549 [Dehalococcoidia bacterium]|nr:hypothetical protein [Chloroflexota bacterium]MBT9162982.1 hypothetical protein [Chloroflexota bacterium]
MRAALYVRVSTEEQVEGYSLDAQLRSMRGFCAERGWEIVGEYIEEGRSARSENIGKRPQFKVLMNDAFSGKVEVVVVHKLDRFSRNLIVTLTYFQEFAKRNIAFVSLSEQMDFSSPSGRLMLAMMGAFAQWYSDNLAHETSKGKRERALQGYYNGDLPFGYIKGDDGIPVIEPKEAVAIERAFPMYATGDYGFQDVANEVNTMGFLTRNKRKQDIYGAVGPRPFTCDSVRDMISNPFYAGYITYKGERILGKQQAIIPKDVYEKCCQVRRKHRKAPRTHSPRFRTYLLKGLIRCAFCGEKLWVNASPSGSKYYREVSGKRGRVCLYPDKYVRAEELDQQVDGVMKSLVIPQAWQIEMMNILTSLDERTRIAREKERIEEKIRRLRRLYAELEIGEAEYELGKRRLEVSLASLVVPKENEMIRAGEKLKSMLEIWGEATEEEKAKMLAIMLDAVYCDTNRKKIVALKLKSPFLPVFSLCDGLKENDGLIFMPELVGIGDPEGIRTPDLHRDRVAC